MCRGLKSLLRQLNRSKQAPLSELYAPVLFNTQKYVLLEVKEIKTVLTIALLLALAWNMYMLAYAFTRRDRRRALCFSLLTMAVLFYTLGYLLEINATTRSEAMMALRVENVGIPLVMPFFLMTALGFYQPRLLRPWMNVISGAYGVIMFLVIFFNDKHLLYYTKIDMVYNGSFFASQLGKGPLYFVQQAVSTTGMFTVYVLLATRFIRGSIKLRHQMRFFIVGSLLGLASNLAYFSGIIPYGIDPTPFALTIGLMFFAVVLRKHKLMDVVPAAFDMAIENMDDAAIVLDNDWGFIYCNEKAKHLFPALGSFSGSEEIMRAEGWPVEINPKSEKQVFFEFVNPTTGKITQQKSSIYLIYDKLGREIGISVIIRDITETVSMLKQLEALAITDDLTGVFNRRHFMTIIDRQIGLSKRHNLPVSILMLDIDHFKDINDTYSHLAGDHILREMTAAVSRQMRAHDVIARYGGEEFIIMSAEKDEESLLIFTNRLRKAIENEVFEFDGNTIRVTASFGAVLIKPGQSFDAGMVAVDKALYEAKNSGRNMVVLGVIQPDEAIPPELSFENYTVHSNL